MRASAARPSATVFLDPSPVPRQNRNCVLQGGFERDCTVAFVRAIVQGRVQGVGYRWFARDTAKRLAVKGFVRNLPDGDVEVQAIGDRAVLEKLVGLLNRGPGFGYVTDVVCEWRDEGPDFSDFQIAF